jgi:hypothetical protein
VDQQILRASIRWNPLYRPDWDDDPGRYVEDGVVAWGKSRRLGIFLDDPVKAYIGVQHVDPAKGGWSMFEAPTARYFTSLFVEGRIVTLRTFPTLNEALIWLASKAGPLIATEGKQP